MSSKLPVDRGGGRRGDALASSLRRPRGQTDSGEEETRGEGEADGGRGADSLEEGERGCKSDSLSPRSSERRSALPLAVAPSAQTAAASVARRSLAPDDVVAALARAHILKRA